MNKDIFICPTCKMEMQFYGDTPLCGKCNAEQIMDYYWMIKMKREMEENNNE